MRLGLGIIAGALCASFNVFIEGSPPLGLEAVLKGLAIALLIYAFSYYIIERAFSLKVKRPRKLLTTGIGIYFIAWFVTWAFLYTLFAPP